MQRRTTTGKKGKGRLSLNRYEGVLICVGAFRYIYDIGKKRSESLMAHLHKNGLVTREHGNLGKKPHNALCFNEVKNCIAFISRHAEIYGIPTQHPSMEDMTSLLSIFQPVRILKLCMPCTSLRVRSQESVCLACLLSIAFGVSA